MIDIWDAVEWWDEWQLRILVLGSLGVQWFLLLAAPLRKYSVPHCFRTCIWLAYIGSDALAIYALATLFNRHARATSGCCSIATRASALEVLWAPILLIHLGGREEITAYNIEDNELWTRQTVTLVSQVTVALYAFYKSWPGSSDRRLLASAILLFIIGILSFSEKPWALRRASINRLAAVSSLIEGRRRKKNFLEFCFTELEDKHRCWKKQRGENNRDASILSELDKVHMILSDMSLFAAANDLKKRRKNQGQDQILAPLSPGTEMSSKRWLRKAFGLIYTRANVINTPAYLAYHLLLVPLLHIAAITLFATSHKNVYEATDVKMTYIFLGFTAALDVLAVFIRQLLFQIMGSAGVAALCETLPGHNLIASVVRRIHPVSGGLLKCVTSIGCKEDYFICEDDSLYRKVAGLVLVDLMSAPRLKGLDLGTYRSFTRANWALSMELQKACNMGRTDNDAISHSISGSPQADLVQEATNQTIHESEIQRSLRKESFDESVLLWHIATDLCFRKMPQPEGKLREVCTQAISNYMAHLLNFRPEMLMTGSRQHLFTEAIGNIESILGKGFQYHYTAGDDEILVKKIMDEADKAQAISIYPLIHDACKLAKDLIQLQDETRWELMYRVWLGMLCYSASMCRGYLHAKTLGEGGEFLSFVWLVLSLKGAKTLADKLQMPELDPGEEPQVEETPTATPDLYSELLAAL